MNKKFIIIAAAIITITISINAATEKIGLVINTDLFPLIEEAINTYTSELKSIQNIDVVWVETGYGAEREKYKDLWNDIKEHYDNDGIDGVIFIGDLPIVDCGTGDFNPDPQCDLYWMDMDENAFSGYGPEFSSYSGSGPEIWMTRVTTSYFESEINKSEDEIVNDYFARVSERMHGGLVDEDTLMFIMGDDGISYWAGIDNEHLDEMYYTNTEVYLETQGKNSKTYWLDGLNEGHEYFVVFNHSSHSMHQTSPYCRISDLYTSEGDIRFGQMFACLNSRLDYANMVAAYGLLNKGLGCNGAGKSGSIMPGHYHYFNDPLHEEGNLFGDALKQWWQDDGIKTMSWASANVMEGVGTLQLKPYDEVTEISTTKIPAGTATVKFRQSARNISIYVPFSSTSKIIITDMMGRTITSFNIDKADWHILPVNLAPGVHIARITSQKQNMVCKFEVIR